MLDELAGITPKHLWLRKFDERDGAVTFDGTAGSIDDVSIFLTDLKKSTYFSGADLRKTSAKIDGKLKLVEFTISAKVNYTAGLQVAASETAPGAPGTR